MKLLVIFIIFFTSCSGPQDYSQIKVIEAIDGDTVKLSGGRLLRYIGIDTPEVRIKKGDKFVYDPQPFALDAKEFNRRLVEGKTARIEFDVEGKDRYGRMLGYLFIDDTLVNAKLVEAGLAVLYTKPPNVKYTDLFVSLQKEARKKKKGLWGAYEVISSSQAYRFIDQIRTVRDKVLNTHKSLKAVFLNFGRNYREDFTVVIFKNCLENFYKKSIEPHIFYRGKTVEVTGRIKEYNGPEIIVCSPEEITVISDQ